ncbi:uncharacterized protein LOC6576575 [Drosophila mojavensis]|uniref:Uncharacterized protein n=1 Tax=Drosophila mojavensis TaxID=7230 RepID=B4KFA6_DROMO|nr:uncharacterized protein LOC6576575 [Drosophila mojavensis]EDW12006.2 uncharacterized protein Dmoj_GI12023 [Drosophila mojavensis]
MSWLLSNNGLLLLASLFVCVYIYFYSFVRFELAKTEPTINPEQSISQEENSQIPSQNKFNVFDHVCKIPRVDPFSPDVMAIFEPPKPKTCTDQPGLFTVRYNKQQKLYLLRFNKSLFVKLFPSVTHYACVFYEIVSGPSDKPIWNKGSPFTCSNRIVPRSIQGIVVECFELGNKSRILQRDAFSFVQHLVGRNEANDEKRSRAYPSVIMLGIDSMSQMNFQRTMPMTAKFVRQTGWSDMLGYNGLFNNGFKNMFDLLSGGSPQLWEQHCDVKRLGCLDTITFLWNHFHNSGYLTAYAEDSLSLAFTRKPVDYYLYPILKVFKEIMEREGRGQGESDYCLGRRESFHYVFESCLQLVQRFMNETPKPLFGLYWTKTFSHEDFSAAARVDRNFVRYLELYREHGLFDKAVVILFSLHGQRKGPLMRLASGFLEERLPMLHIYLPPWYRKQYPDVRNALEVNRRRLCSTYDLHLTIKNLLTQVHPNLEFEVVCNSCMSLLYIIPENRSCAGANIPEWICSCEPCRRVPNTELMRTWAKLIVFRINQYLARKKLIRYCSHLKFEHLITVDHQELYNSEGQIVKPADGIQRYRIKFITQPNGVFLGNIFINSQNNIADVPYHRITRFNTHSKCVDGSINNNLCVCR